MRNVHAVAVLTSERDEAKAEAQRSSLRVEAVRGVTKFACSGAKVLLAHLVYAVGFLRQPLQRFSCATCIARAAGHQHVKFGAASRAARVF